MMVNMSRNGKRDRQTGKGKGDVKEMGREEGRKSRRRIISVNKLLLQSVMSGLGFGLKAKIFDLVLGLEARVLGLA